VAFLHRRRLVIRADVEALLILLLLERVVARIGAASRTTSSNAVSRYTASLRLGWHNDLLKQKPLQVVCRSLGGTYNGTARGRCLGAS
jgi:hypothetical protein